MAHVEHRIVMAARIKAIRKNVSVPRPADSLAQIAPIMADVKALGIGLGIYECPLPLLGVKPTCRANYRMSPCDPQRNPPAHLVFCSVSFLAANAPQVLRL